jgi:hypothetical protein
MRPISDVSTVRLNSGWARQTVLERCTTATVGDFSRDLSQRTCVCRDQLDEVGLPVGAGLREQMLKMGLESGFRDADVRRNSTDLAHRREHAQFARRQLAELRHCLHRGWYLDRSLVTARGSGPISARQRVGKTGGELDKIGLAAGTGLGEYAMQMGFDGRFGDT